jgi:diketogulonate reductase-like aldo/keto reductase
VKAWGAAIAKHRGLRRATVAVARKLSVIMHRRRERVDWREHLETLFAMKAAGKIGHTGITTSHGRRHELFERIMREYPLDFVQLTYNILDREPEERLLPLARDRGIAVMVNRPFRQKAPIRRFDGVALPGWADKIGASSWTQFILKFILSHPAKRSRPARRARSRPSGRRVWASAAGAGRRHDAKSGARRR